MTFKVKRVQMVIGVVKYDLIQMPYDQWPEEAKEIARRLYSPTVASLLESMLPELRKPWLVAKVEAAQALREEFKL